MSGKMEKKAEEGEVKSINRLINTEFEKSKVQKLRNKIGNVYYDQSILNLISNIQMLAQGNKHNLTQRKTLL